jgi:hypothetical protein
MKKAFFIKFIASFIAFIISFSPFVSFAQSSVNPKSLAELYALEHGTGILGVQAATAAPIVPVAGQAVAVSAQVLSPTGALLGTSLANGTFVPAAATTGALVAGGLVGYGTGAGIAALQDLAKNKYCNANTGSNLCGASRYVAYSTNTFQDWYFTSYSLGNGCWGSGVLIHVVGAAQGGSTCIASLSSIRTVTSPPSPWSSWPQSARNTAITYLSPTDYSTAITSYSTNINSSTASTTITNFITQNYPSSSTNLSTALALIPSFKIQVNVPPIYIAATLQPISGSLSLSQFDSYFGGDVSSTVTNYVNTNYYNNTTTNNNGAITGTTTITNTVGGTTTTTTTKTDLRLGLPEPDGNLPSPACPDLNCINKLTRPNFVVYATDQLSTKFPFDIYTVSDHAALLSQATNRECPSVEIWGETKEFCIIRQFFQAIKYGLWLSYLVYSIHSL